MLWNVDCWHSDSEHLKLGRLRRASALVFRRQGLRSFELESAIVPNVRQHSLNVQVRLKVKVWQHTA